MSSVSSSNLIKKSLSLCMISTTSPTSKSKPSPLLQMAKTYETTQTLLHYLSGLRLAATYDFPGKPPPEFPLRQPDEYKPGVVVPLEVPPTTPNVPDFDPIPPEKPADPPPLSPDPTPEFPGVPKQDPEINPGPPNTTPPGPEIPLPSPEIPTPSPLGY